MITTRRGSSTTRVSITRRLSARVQRSAPDTGSNAVTRPSPIDHHEILRRRLAGTHAGLERRGHAERPRPDRTGVDVERSNPCVEVPVAGRDDGAPVIQPGRGRVQPDGLLPAHRTGREVEARVRRVPATRARWRRRPTQQRRPAAATTARPRSGPTTRAHHWSASNARRVPPVSPASAYAPARATACDVAVHRLFPADRAVAAPEGDDTSGGTDEHEILGDGRVPVLGAVDLRLPLRGAVEAEGAHPAGVGGDHGAASVGGEAPRPAGELARPDRRRPSARGRTRRRRDREHGSHHEREDEHACPHGVPPGVSPSARVSDEMRDAADDHGRDRAAQRGVDPDARRRTALERGAHGAQRIRVLHDRRGARSGSVAPRPWSRRAPRSEMFVAGTTTVFGRSDRREVDVRRARRAAGRRRSSGERSESWRDRRTASAAGCESNSVGRRVERGLAHRRCPGSVDAGGGERARLRAATRA